MLETIREYAREKLQQSGEAEELGRVHAEYFLALAEEAEPELGGPQDKEWLERLEAEHDNLRAAISWTLERGEDAEVALRLAGALWPFWEAHGHYGEGRRWLEEALEKDDQASSAAARAKVLEGLGWLTYRQGDTDRAKEIAEEGLKLSDEAGLGGVVTANFLNILGWMAEVQGHHEWANELLEKSLSLSREVDDKRAIAYSLLQLGSTRGALGDLKRQKELYEEGIVLSRQLGYTAIRARLLLSLGYTLLLEGDYERGAALNEEAAVLLRERGYKGGSLEFVLDNLGWAALLQGDHERARTSYRESLTLCKELGNRMIASESLEGLACVSAAEGDAERAARLFGGAETLHEATGDQHTPEEAALREPYLAMSRSQLDEAAWHEAWTEGRAMTLEEAISYALEKNAYG
jgi:tetratricopeptide (TPR) repeat protein